MQVRSADLLASLRGNCGVVARELPDGVTVGRELICLVGPLGSEDCANNNIGEFLEDDVARV